MQTKAVDTLRYADGPPGQDARRAEVTCVINADNRNLPFPTGRIQDSRRIDTLRPSYVSD